MTPLLAPQTYTGQLPAPGNPSMSQENATSSTGMLPHVAPPSSFPPPTLHPPNGALIGAYHTTLPFPAIVPPYQSHFYSHPQPSTQLHPGSYCALPSHALHLSHQPQGVNIVATPPTCTAVASDRNAGWPDRAREKGWPSTSGSTALQRMQLLHERLKASEAAVSRRLSRLAKPLEIQQL